MAQPDVTPAWVFLPEQGESKGNRIARCAEQALADGPMGLAMRGPFYKEFVSCGFDPPLVRAGTWLNRGIGIETLKTSCGVFVRAVMHWAGRTATRPGKVAQALLEPPGDAPGWLEGLNFGHEAWVWAESGYQPRRGAIFYRDYGRSPTADGHVGIFIRRTEEGLWVTAEGGGSDASSPRSNGTVCRMKNPHDPFDLEGTSGMKNRGLVGWWDPNLLDGWAE